MPKDNNILGDLSKMASSVFATLVNIKNEVMSYTSHKMKCTLKDLDCASKNELNALKKTVHHLKDDIASIKPEPVKAAHPKAASKPKASKGKISSKSSVKSAEKPASPSAKAKKPQ
jgi:hypothetical protein